MDLLYRTMKESTANKGHPLTGSEVRGSEAYRLAAEAVALATNPEDLALGLGDLAELLRNVLGVRRKNEVPERFADVTVSMPTEPVNSGAGLSVTPGKAKYLPTPLRSKVILDEKGKPGLSYDPVWVIDKSVLGPALTFTLDEDVKKSVVVNGVREYKHGFIGPGVGITTLLKFEEALEATLGAWTLHTPGKSTGGSDAGSH